MIRHKAMDYHRGNGRLSNALAQRAILQEVDQTQKQSNSHASARLEQIEQANDVLAVLEDLDETKRQCLEWKYIERLSVREMAARLDLTEKAVESILYRARLEFRERFEKCALECTATTLPKQSVEPSSRRSDQ